MPGDQTGQGDDRITQSDPLDRRFRGVTRTIWNQPWTRTLVAETHDKELCEVLLIRRWRCFGLISPPGAEKRTIKHLLKQPPQFLKEFCQNGYYRKHVGEFLKENLVRLLANNRFFRDLLYLGEVDWPALLGGMQGKTASRLPVVASKIRKHPRLDGDFSAWLAPVPTRRGSGDSARGAYRSRSRETETSQLQ